MLLLFLYILLTRTFRSTYMKYIGVIVYSLLCFGSNQLRAQKLNRPHYKQKKEIPSIPIQSKRYINVANYNIRYAYPGSESPQNTWQKRKPFFFKTIGYEDEANRLMEQMQNDLQDALKSHLPAMVQNKEFACDKDCFTCRFKNKEPFPIGQTASFRLALKVGYDMEKECVYGNFPYPYRLIIVLRRHASRPSPEEFAELASLLHALETDVADQLGAEYTSYAKLGDVYYRNKDTGKKVSKEPHYILHFVFRFPKGKKIQDVSFDDPNPYDQFQLFHSNLVKEGNAKANTNIIYKKMPEVITFQEVTYLQAQDLKKEMPLHDFIGFTAYDGTPLKDVKPDDWIDELLTIGYKKERFVCLESGVRWLSKTPHVPSHDEGASRNRIVIWAKLKDKESAKEFFVFNAHYDHLGLTQAMVDAETSTIKEVAQDDFWVALGERFYVSCNGASLYQYFLQSIDCADVRDLSIMGHYGEPGSWGGFEDDPYASKLQEGGFECETLDVGFMHPKNSLILFSYAFNGAYDSHENRLYEIDEEIGVDHHLASDHFMLGFYWLFD